MENVATSVRIPGDAIGTLSQLASKLGQSKAQVIRRALEEMEERVFWAEVSEAFARDAEDPVELARQRSEIEAWEGASATDFRDEKW